MVVLKGLVLIISPIGGCDVLKRLTLDHFDFGRMGLVFKELILDSLHFRRGWS